MTKATRRKFILSTVATAFSLPLVTRAQGENRSAAAPNSKLSKEFLDRLPELMEWANVPCISIAQIERGQLASTLIFGVRKAGDAELAPPDTVFGAASLSKPVLAYAIMRMRDEKLIDLDRPLWDYLPYEDLPAGEQAKQITARHALSHSTGLQNWRFNRDSKLEFAFKPGERFQYSGEGFYYLQRVVEKITGRGFEEYMQERVLKPLGMKTSTFSWTAGSESRLSWGHNGRMVPQELFNAQRGRRMLALAPEWKKPIEKWTHDDAARAQSIISSDQPVFPNFLLPNAAGSLMTSVSEYSRFMVRLFGFGKPDALSLSDASRREMLTPQTKINKNLSWGLGIGLESYQGRTLFWHWGDNGTFKAFMMGDPASGSGVIVFANAQNGHRLWQRVAAEKMGRDHPAFYFFMT